MDLLKKNFFWKNFLRTLKKIPITPLSKIEDSEEKVEGKALSAVKKRFKENKSLKKEMVAKG